ncbi:uncharacterized protein OGAPODRAFT_15330 [Ogataea polymorpha]|uniref:uncharacterized protein n=1 Tax=Ogataea polymorpha TaxID=460523 RepID=UPI0007F3C6BF|nr:uncharacterized protein OGAPODRAFT_15330 [Ogataea polymorpha]OBA18658.1 hypothetical protein OGAPODRAFT_15330 [Ogataea polymorpha]
MKGEESDEFPAYQKLCPFTYYPSFSRALRTNIDLSLRSGQIWGTIFKPNYAGANT